MSREIEDGAGICSPGRWPLDRRPHDDRPIATRIRDALGETLTTIGSRIDLRLLTLGLATGKFKQSPFTGSEVSQAVQGISRVLQEAGLPHGPRGDDVEQALNVRLLEALARAAGDPDPGIAEMAATGVKTGALSPLPRTPAVYEKKVKWPLESEADHAWTGERARPNYVSAADRPDILRKQFEEEVAEGLMLKTTAGEARARWGPHLVVASLAAVVKNLDKDEWRIVYDATNGVHLNHRIRVRDQIRMPLWQDISKTLEASREDGTNSHFALKYDVSKAHRRVPIDPREWGLLACRAGGSDGDSPQDHETLYINKVGTFGVGSAGYWWSRLFGLVMRIIYWVTGRSLPLYHLVYADDGLLIAAGPHFEQPLILAFLLLEVLGVPLTWKKVKGGLLVDWIGLRVDVRGYRLGLSDSRLEWAKAWTRRVAEAPGILVSEISEGLGRLIFITGPLGCARPFLGPIYAWIAACPPGAFLTPPLIVRMVLRWFAEVIATHPWRLCRVGQADAGEAFRIDAKAEPDGTVILGGWSTTEGGQTSAATWFSHRVTPSEAPWAFQKGDPGRVVASLELLAVLYGVILLVPDTRAEGARTGSIEISAGTDNQGNRALNNKGLTTKLPLALVAMELASQLASRDLALDLKWRRRDLNQEADDLTNEKFAAFDPRLRVEASGVAGKLKVLTSLMTAYEEHLSAVRPAATESRVPPGRGKKRREPLRVRDPW